MTLAEMTAGITSPRLTGTGAGWAPGAFDVLVLDASSRQSLATVRSLGRAGLRVALGECSAECDASRPVLAFRSRYSAHNVVLPSFATDITAFATAVVEFVQEHRIRVVLPASDGAVVALMHRREQLADLGCLLALPSDAALEVANDKGRTLELARRLGIEHPKTTLINSVDDLPAMLADFEFPVVLKPTSSWVWQSANRLQAVEVIDEAEAIAVTRTFISAGAGVLAQSWVGGRREGVTLFIVDGEVQAGFAHLEHRTSPALGGASVLRESVAMPEDIYDSSVRLAVALGLEGLCEVEFRRDADGRPLLMEINARLAGPIEIAMHSGINFPLMVWQWAAGLGVDRVEGYETGVRMRWLRGDMRWLRDNHRRVGRPDSVSRTRALWVFASEFFRTLRYDCFDWRDLGPAMAEVRTTAAAVRNRSQNPQPPSHIPSRKGKLRVS
jgi:predicted ATP-grasp superfamily ATP-dependent carboligase